MNKEAVSSLEGELGSIARESIYIYSAGFLSALTGFVYWIVAAKLVPSSALGAASTIVSLVSIITVVSSLGLNMAVLRIGSIYRSRIGQVSWTALTLNLVAVLIVLTVGLPIYMSTLDSTKLVLFVVYLALIAAPAISLRSILIALRRARYLPYVQVANTIARMGAGIAILLIMPKTEGVILGYLLGSLAITLTLLTITMRERLLELHISRHITGELLRAGIPIWLPSTIAVLGTQLAVVFTYVSRGGSEAGYLYIAQTIALTVDGAKAAIVSALIPSIASETIDRNALREVIRIAYAILLPINMALFFFPETVLRPIGMEYLAAVNPLRIFTLTNIVLLISGPIIAHIYATGNYRYTLLINISMSTTRVALYTILTPLYGATGASTAYLIGTLVATILAIPEIVKTRLPWQTMTSSLTLALLLGAILLYLEGKSYTPLMLYIALIIYILLAYLMIAALKLLRREEIIKLLEILRNTIKQLYKS